MINSVFHFMRCIRELGSICSGFQARAVKVFDLEGHSCASLEELLIPERAGTLNMPKGSP